MTDTPLLSADFWPDNGALIADIHKLFPLDMVRDITFGRGKWWTQHQPRVLTGSDLKPGPKGWLAEPHNPAWTTHPERPLWHHLTGVDYHKLTDSSNCWPVVAFDPPYIPQSAKQAESSNIKEFHDRFGLNTTGYRTPEELRNGIAVGIGEAGRVVQKGGLLLVKCMPYAYSAQHYPQPAWTIADAEQLRWCTECEELISQHRGCFHQAGQWKLRVDAQYIHLKHEGGPQPTHSPSGKERIQRNPRANYSTMIVFRKVAA